jgi:hypothetical protein
MAHFARINEDNIVVEVLVIDNSLENRGEDFLANELGLGGTWIQTSYNNNFRKQFAGIGYKYDYANDLFIAPQPYPSWNLDGNFNWQPPIPKPNEGRWTWDEDLGAWVESETL